MGPIIGQRGFYPSVDLRTFRNSAIGSVLFLFILQFRRANTTMIFVVLTVVVMEKILSWDVKPDKSLVEVADPSKMTVHIYQTIRHCIPEDLKFVFLCILYESNN